MLEALNNAKEELKRADHLIYVSLKYTRTCDVFKSIIDRLINAIDFSLDALLKKLEEAKKISSLPTAPVLKCNVIKEQVKDEEISKLIDFYLMLRQINRCKYTRSKEFRRNVTMSVDIGNGKTLEINIDVITEYFKNTRKHIEHIEEIMKS